MLQPFPPPPQIPAWGTGCLSFCQAPPRHFCYTSPSRRAKGREVKTAANDQRLHLPPGRVGRNGPRQVGADPGRRQDAHWAAVPETYPQMRSPTSETQAHSSGRFRTSPSAVPAAREARPSLLHSRAWLHSSVRSLAAWDTHPLTSLPVHLSSSMTPLPVPGGSFCHFLILQAAQLPC